MRSISPATLSWLRAAVASDSSLASRPASQVAGLCALQRNVHSSRTSIPQSSSRRRTFTTNLHNLREEPLKSHTHYHLFPQSLPSGPPPHGRFAVDLPSLRKEFLQLQARAHPDLHPAEHKNKAQALSARINEAYKTLQSPLLRAQYLLSLRGIDIHEDETAKVEDAELLMEVLDARERIEEAEDEAELEEMKEENDVRIKNSAKVLEGAFEKDDIELAKSEAVRLRYWVNIKESLDGWEKGKPVVLAH
ncbi:Co-chaperone Hsc20 [Lophium mytilinum]|uniref:Co-chaperone Hsc20 n=1 Tax=Lophium mytilinum TaxID=390894 RepID=A0A6A6R2Y3_9PEZI|nr:Co-chaperone Hsc20 [Lophium mytilinum]